MQKTVLVTGGAGFIGAHLSQELLNQNYKVVVLDDLSGGFQENVPKNAIFHQGSITDTVIIEQLFQTYHFTYVYHLAAYAAEGLSPFIRKFNYENNLIGSINLINAAVNHKVACFVFTSSIAVYGSMPVPYTEAQHPQPEDPYGIAKLAVEQDLKNAYEQFGLNSIIFRPHNVYGPLQNIGDRYRNVIGIFMNQLLQEQPLTIFGDGKQKRAFTYIHDIVPYMAQSVAFAKAYNQTFNIGSDTVYTVNELAQTVCDVMGIKGAVQHLPSRNEVVEAFSDHSKFTAIFTPKTETTLSTGLQEMADWVKIHGSRKSLPFSAIEITKNLPESWK